MSKESPETIFAVIHDGELCSAFDKYLDALTLAVNGSYVDKYFLARSCDDEVTKLHQTIDELDGEIRNLREEIERLIEKENDCLHAQRD